MNLKIHRVPTLESSPGSLPFNRIMSCSSEPGVPGTPGERESARGEMTLTASCLDHANWGNAEGEANFSFSKASIPRSLVLPEGSDSRSSFPA
jgi:hypothetical protein